ncbi:hypothetical protein [Mesorhizobium sp. Root157]|uniref:hypothetical protein n=1 Tax=Mesorhizobium sp. Root157 TaxID=1736477 RepID=UPI000B2E9869|nr:hypothetical protein [Mesorhizobium sp. Root157]
MITTKVAFGAGKALVASLTTFTKGPVLARHKWFAWSVALLEGPALRTRSFVERSFRACLTVAWPLIALEIALRAFAALGAGLARHEWLARPVALLEGPALRTRPFVERSFCTCFALAGPVVALEIALRAFAALGAGLARHEWFARPVAFLERLAFWTRTLAEGSFRTCLTVAWPLITLEIALWPLACSSRIGSLDKRFLLARKSRLARFNVARRAITEAGWLCAGLALEFVVVTHVVFARLRG